MCPQDQSIQTSQEPPSFEVALEQLQAAVKKLESGELSLEIALKQFEEGVRLSRLCQEHLATAEQRVEVLTKVPTTEGTEGLELRPFSVPKA